MIPFLYYGHGSILDCLYPSCVKPDVDVDSILCSLASGHRCL